MLVERLFSTFSRIYKGWMRKLKDLMSYK